MFSKFIEDPDLNVSELINTAGTSKHRDLADLTLNVQLSLCTRHKGICGNWNIAALILNFVTRWLWMVSFTSWPLYRRGKSPHYPLNRRLGGPQSQCGRFEEGYPLSLPGIGSRFFGCPTCGVVSILCNPTTDNEKVLSPRLAVSLWCQTFGALSTAGECVVIEYRYLNWVPAAISGCVRGFQGYRRAVNCDTTGEALAKRLRWGCVLFLLRAWLECFFTPHSLYLQFYQNIDQRRTRRRVLVFDL